MNDRKVNILYLASSLQIGGTERLLIDLVKNINNVEYTIVIMNDSINETLKKELEETGVNLHFFYRKKGHKHPKYIFKLLKIIKMYNISCIHTHNPGSKLWAILCKLFNPKLKLIYAIHDTFTFENTSSISLFLHRKFIDVNVAISKSVLTHCKHYNISKTHLIYNGINLKYFVPTEKPIKTETEKIHIISVSRIDHKVKGQDILIKACDELKKRNISFKCLLIGGIYDYGINSYKFLQGLITKLGLKNEISFLDNVSNLLEIYSDADIFILPSRKEGFGLALLEAMSMKIPVIASNLGGPKELITNGKNGILFEPGNHIALAESIIDLANNDLLREHLITTGSQFVQSFEISIMCQQYYELYYSLATHHRLDL